MVEISMIDQPQPEKSVEQERFEALAKKVFQAKPKTAKPNPEKSSSES